MSFRLAIAGVLLAGATCAAAEARVQVEFPLGPVYRPGKYVPVRVSYSLADVPRNGVIRLDSAGAASTAAHLAPGDHSIIVPWLLYQPADGTWSIPHTGARGSIESNALRPLSRQEKLVMLAADQQPVREVLAELFGAVRIVPVAPQDAADPLPGPAAAWELLDAVVIDGPTFSRLGMTKLAPLAAGGTSIIVLSQQRPVGAWPWVRHGPAWVLKHDVAGPRQLVYDDDGQIYMRVSNWTPHWPAALRWRLVVYGVLALLVLTATALVPWRWAGVLALLLAGGATAGFMAWRQSQSPIATLAGEIRVESPQAVQHDRWVFRSPLMPSAAATPWEPNLRPVFASPRHRELIPAALVCKASGEPAYWSYELGSRMKLAMFSRSLSMSRPADPVQPVEHTPLWDLADARYLRRAWSVVGQVPAPAGGAMSLDQSWPTVILSRPAPTTQP